MISIETVEKPKNNNFMPCKWLILLDVYFDRRQYLGFFDSLICILYFIDISGFGTNTEKQGAANNLLHVKKYLRLGEC